MQGTCLLADTNKGVTIGALENATVICHPHDVPTHLQNTDVVIDWNSRESFRDVYPQLYDARRILFLFDDTLIDMTDASLVERHKQQALAASNYTRCKTINRALIEYSVIKRLDDTKCFPSEIQLEATDICNAKCVMCSHFYRQGTRAITEHSEILQSIAEVLPYLDTVYLHGNGEPFLTPAIDDYVESLAAYGIKCTANTNLSVLTDRNLNTIDKYFFELNVSVDGADAKTYEYVRRGLSFERLIANCKRLRRHCPNLHIRMWSVMMRQNILSLSKIVQLAASLNFDEVVFTELSSDERLNNMADVALCYPNVLAKELERAKEVAASYGIVLVAPQYELHGDLEQYEKEMAAINAQPLFYGETYFQEQLHKIHHTPEVMAKPIMRIEGQRIPCVANISTRGICDWSVARPFIDLEGNVSLCCVNQHVVLGNLFEQTFGEIWNGVAARNIRRTFYAYRVPYFCSGCEFIIQDRLQYLRVSSCNETLYNKIRLRGGE